MSKLAAILFAAAIALGACQDQGASWSGEVAKARGRCWIVMVKDDKTGRLRAYSVWARDGKRFGLKQGQHVTIYGTVDLKGGCAATVLLNPTKIEID